MRLASEERGRPRAPRRPPAAARRGRPARRGRRGPCATRRATSRCSSTEGGRSRVDAAHPVVVPFGGADHDWAALELGAWIATARRAAAAARRGCGWRRRSRREPAARERLARRAAACRSRDRAGARARARRTSSARRRTQASSSLGLSDRWRERGARPGALRDRAAGSGADDLRPPRPPARRARTRRRHDAVPLVRLRRDDDRPLKRRGGVERAGGPKASRSDVRVVTGDARPLSRVVHRPIVKKLPGYWGSPVESMRGRAASVWPAAAGLRSVM